MHSFQCVEDRGHQKEMQIEKMERTKEWKNDSSPEKAQSSNVFPRFTPSAQR
jgi:hypothetical protein